MDWMGKKVRILFQNNKVVISMHRDDSLIIFPAGPPALHTELRRGDVPLVPPHAEDATQAVLDRREETLPT